MGRSSSANSPPITFISSLERLLEEIIVDIPYQMNQAFLLRASDGIVGGVEIRYQHTAEFLQDILGRACFTSGAIERKPPLPGS